MRGGAGGGIRFKKTDPLQLSARSPVYKLREQERHCLAPQAPPRNPAPAASPVYSLQNMGSDSLTVTSRRWRVLPRWGPPGQSPVQLTCYCRSNERVPTQPHHGSNERSCCSLAAAATAPAKAHRASGGGEVASGTISGNMATADRTLTRCRGRQTARTPRGSSH
jgi:hypothetical protein